MDAFLARLSYHATSYAVRSCIALTSTYVINQGAKLLKVRHIVLAVVATTTTTKQTKNIMNIRTSRKPRLTNTSPTDSGA